MADQPKDRGESRPALYELEAEAIRAKTERLRALRLARDGADKPAPTAAKPRSGRKTSAKVDKSAGTLADWLKSQTEQGRRS